jgi:hypothetical protein
MGMIGIWNEGMAYIANHTAGYNNKGGYVIQDSYSMTINLADLESNVGKELYNDGNHRIYVAWVNNTGSANSGGYSIGFRSSGQYSLKGATLVSGVQHITLGEHSFTSKMSAQMTAEYHAKSYGSSASGHGGLNYKNGDDFSFYLFPPEAYDSKEVTLDETGEVRLTISNLYMNVWSKNN